MMLHKEFWGLMFLFFVGWSFLGGDGGERIERGCRPIGWAGNAIVSLTALGVPSQQTRVAGWFDKFEYGCQYAAWRLIYEKEYQDYLAEKAAAEDGSGIEGTPPPSDPSVIENPSAASGEPRATEGQP